ncbi:hypothetical protein BGZ74_000579 [Mortierella antarctica]|nr:hypothetical protein BGZ74_000579 [Mortierella antarctica]
MTSEAPTWVSRYTTHDHNHTIKPYQSTIDHARAYAAELGPDMALAFDQLNHRTAMVLRAYIAAVYQEGHLFNEVERVQDAMKLYVEDAFGCWGTTWQFLSDQDETTIENSGMNEERGEWIGNPIYDPAILSLLQEFKIRRSPTNTDRSPCFDVILPFRKSNPIDRSQANVYQIFPRPHEPHACCVSSVLEWIQYVELTKGQRLHADDFLFPRPAKDDSIQLKKQFTVTEVSSRLNKFAADAGLMGHRYTRLDTHCFRRGGAQYRLLHPQDPWSLTAVKWWGGWSERESTEKILDYLLNESQYEASFGDMLSPQGSRTRGHADTAKLRVEMLMMKERFDSVLRAVARLENEVEALKLNNGSLRLDLKQDNVEYHRAVIQANMELRQEITGLADTIMSRLDKSQGSSSTPSYTQQRSTTGHSYSQQLSTTDLYSHSHAQRQQRQSHQSEHTNQPNNEDLDPPEEHEPAYEPRQQQKAPQEPPAERIPTILSWREAIKQWEEGDPENGLTVPLRDWSVAWRRRSGAHYIRKLIVKEYEHFDRDADKMHAVYGANMTGVVSRFVRAINKRHRRQTDGAARNRKKRTRGGAGSDSDDNVYLKEEEEDEEVEPLSVVPKLNDVDFGPPPVVKFVGDLSYLPVVPKINHWRQAIQQWEHGDPEKGLMVPIRDWPLEWRKADRVNKTYHNRKRIVDEFEACGRDEAEMRKIHGKKMDGAYSLLVSINSRRRKELRQRKEEEALEDAGRDDDDDDDDDVWEDALEQAEVEVKEEEEEPTLIRKRKYTPSGDKGVDSSKKFRPIRVQPRRQARTIVYRDD